MSQNRTFFDMPISEGMKQTIKLIGYSTPTPIQDKAIPELLMGRDLLGQAQTGTGKTAAFSIPLVEMVEDQKSTIQALVVCPTRELCLQVCQEIKRLSEHKPDLKTVALYGGQSIDQQFRALKYDLPQIVVATPGRLFDHLRRKSVALSEVQMIVLDEADEMLDMGFRPEIEQIFGLLPDENQRIFFSATMPKAINDLACSYLREPAIVKTEAKTLTVSTIDQSYLKIRGREKTDLLCRLIEHRDPKLAVIFCNAKSTADEIVDDLINRGFEAGVLHGDLSQNQRDRVMAKFKMGSVRFLVATDVAARGLDIEDVELVINYHLPHDPEDYVHRIGRTGRAGRKGFAISLVEPRDNSRLRRIAQFARIDIRETQPPSFAEIKTAKIEGFFEQVKKAMGSDRIREYRNVIEKQSLAAEDIAAAMLQMAMKRVDDKPQNDAMLAELNDRQYTGSAPAERRLRDKGGRSGGGRRPDFDRGGDRDRGPRKRFDRGETSGGGRFDRGAGGSSFGGGKRFDRSAGGPAFERAERPRFDREMTARPSFGDRGERRGDRPVRFERRDDQLKIERAPRANKPFGRDNARPFDGDGGFKKKFFKPEGKSFGGARDRDDSKFAKKPRGGAPRFDSARGGDRPKPHRGRNEK